MAVESNNEDYLEELRKKELQKQLREDMLNLDSQLSFPEGAEATNSPTLAAGAPNDFLGSVANSVGAMIANGAVKAEEFLGEARDRAAQVFVPGSPGQEQSQVSAAQVSPVQTPAEEQPAEAAKMTTASNSPSARNIRSASEIRELKQSAAKPKPSDFGMDKNPQYADKLLNMHFTKNDDGTITATISNLSVVTYEKQESINPASPRSDRERAVRSGLTASHFDDVPESKGRRIVDGTHEASFTFKEGAIDMSDMLDGYRVRATFDSNMEGANIAMVGVKDNKDKLQLRGRGYEYLSTTRQSTPNGIVKKQRMKSYEGHENMANPASAIDLVEVSGHEDLDKANMFAAKYDLKEAQERNAVLKEQQQTLQQLGALQNENAQLAESNASLAEKLDFNNIEEYAGSMDPLNDETIAMNLRGAADQIGNLAPTAVQDASALLEKSSGMSHNS